MDPSGDDNGRASIVSSTGGSSNDGEFNVRSGQEGDKGSTVQDDGESETSASHGRSRHSFQDAHDSQSLRRRDGEINRPIAIQSGTDERASEAPLPAEAPPLPREPEPTVDQVHDGWQPVWDPSAQAYYFYNSITHASTWDNPRLPSNSSEVVAVIASVGARPHGGYNPAIHGDYDPNADYAQDLSEPRSTSLEASQSNLEEDYTTSASFSRFSTTPHFVNPLNPSQASCVPEYHDEEHKSRRQMSGFFDVDAAANSHDGRSLKAERQEKRLTKKEVRAFKEKRKCRKEEKRRAWLRE